MTDNYSFLQGPPSSSGPPCSSLVDTLLPTTSHHFALYHQPTPNAARISRPSPTARRAKLLATDDVNGLFVGDKRNTPQQQYILSISKAGSMSNRRSRSVPKKKAINIVEEEEVDKKHDRQRRSSATPHPRKQKTSLLAAPAEAKTKALKERQEREQKRRKQNEHVAKWAGSLREDLHLDDRPSFNLDTTIEGYDNVDKNGRIRHQRDNRLEWAERQKRKDEQAQLNQSWSNSLRSTFHEDDD